MTDEPIINLAPTSIVPTRADSPHVPVTRDEVAADVRRCVDAGAAIVHVHPRDAEGRPSQDATVARVEPGLPNGSGSSISRATCARRWRA